MLLKCGDVVGIDRRLNTFESCDLDLSPFGFIIKIHNESQTTKFGDPMFNRFWLKRGKLYI